MYKMTTTYNDVLNVLSIEPLTCGVFFVQDCGMRKMVSSMTTSESMVRR